jgi:hypothetical protein
MKFLCVTCDEPMRIGPVTGESQGSLSVVFRCAGCGWEMAMLTNPMETQVVRSLGVNIGAERHGGAPASMLRSALADMRAGLSAEPSSETTTAAATPAGRCPFSAMVPGAEPAPPGAERQGGPLPWTDEASRRVEARVPAFVRPMARMAIERYARERGHREVDVQVLDQAREIFMA